MVFLPIVTRELRAVARRPKTYYARMSVAAIWALVGAYVLFATSIMGIAKYDGLALFNTVSSALFGWSMLSAWAGCDSISLEKRDGTIGFLFLTDLKSHDIVLGKMVSAALPSFYGILTALPLMSVCLIMGGVTAGQYAKAGLAILNIFFLGQAVGIFSSTLFRARGNAAGLPLLVLLFYLAAFGLAEMAGELRGWSWPSILFQYFNPARAFYLALTGLSVRASPPGYWVSLLIAHLQAWFFLILAIWALPRLWRDRPKQPGFWKTIWERWRFGSMAARTAFRQRLVTINPMLWLICRGRFSPAFIWSVFGVSASLMVFFFSKIILDDGWWHDNYAGGFVIITICLQLILRLGIPAYASLLEDHRRNGSLETMLCCSPMSVEEILGGVWLVLRRYYRWPTMIVVGAECLMFASALIRGLGHPLNIDLLCFIFVSTVLLIADLRAMAWMAMWTAMSNPKPRSAGATAFFWITMFPWMLVAICYGARLCRSEHWLWILWPMFALLNDFIVGWLAKDRLHKYFRLWATPSYVNVRAFGATWGACWVCFEGDFLEEFLEITGPPGGLDFSTARKNSPPGPGPPTSDARGTANNAWAQQVY